MSKPVFERGDNIPALTVGPWVPNWKQVNVARDQLPDTHWNPYRYHWDDDDSVPWMLLEMEDIAHHAALHANSTRDLWNPFAEPGSIEAHHPRGGLSSR